jgi:hypothetical protein
VRIERPQAGATLAAVKWGFFALVATSVVAFVPAAQSSARPRTTAPPPVVTIKITITDSRIAMHPKRAQRGSMARFILLNLGKKPHTFKLGHERRGTATQTGFTKPLKPSEQHVLIYYLDYRGKLPYFSPLPADRAKPGMKGIFTIF